MSNHPLTYWIDLGGQHVEVRDVKGTEQISAPFRFEIAFAQHEGAAIDPDSVIRSTATLHMMRQGVEQRRVQGVVTHISVGVARGRAPEISFVMEPRFAVARLREDIRIFRNKDATQIIMEVLDGLGIPYESRLTGSYAMRPYTVEWREKDFDFVTRLMEDEGIFYYFTDADVMVLGDSTSAYDEGGPSLPFRAGSGLDGNDDAVWAVRSRASVGPSKMSLRDWNPAHPSLNMDVHAATSLPAGPEHYDYPGEYLEPSVGQRKVGLRAEAVDVAAGAFEGRSFSAKLVPGLVFHIEGAPNGAFDGGRVVTRVTHAFERDKTGFSVGFEARDAGVVYRPPVVTEAPRLLNPVTGFVTGAPGDDICTNEMGAVKVHFHWDRLQPYDDTCSHWIPVLQDNTGHSMGISRVRWEVLVHHLEGDLDRPVVLGRVYNGYDNFPQRLPDMKTRSALKSLWSPREPDGEIQGTNEIQFEDLAGKERIWMYAERDQNTVVANDKDEHVEANETRVIKHDERITIHGNQTIKVGGEHGLIVEGDQKWTVSGDRTRHTVGNESTSVEGNREIKIGGSHNRKLGTDDHTDVILDFTEKISGADTEKSKTNNLIQAEKTSKLTISGSLIELAKENKTESTAQKRTETIDGSVFVTAEGAVAMRCDKERETHVNVSLTAESKEEMVIAGLDKLETHSTTSLFDGSTSLTLKVGDTQIIFKDGTIALVASETISIDTSAGNVLGSGTSTQIGGAQS